MTEPEQKTHEEYMQQCIELANEAKRNGESPCGSIIVRNNKVIGTGIECSKAHQDITYHAEIEALRDAIQSNGSQDLSDCTLYTTHEPCIMCSYMIRHTRIKTVVTGLSVGEVGGYSSKLPLLHDESISTWHTPPTLITGVLESECKKLHD